MPRSKLELYTEILSTIAENPRTLDNIAYKCKMDCVNLSERLDFLRRNNLVEEKTHNNKQFYVLTRRGLSVSKTLSIARRLEKLQNNPSQTQ